MRLISSGLCVAVVCIGSHQPDPRGLLKDADRIAWLKNWSKAEPLYADAERQFAAQGDRRDAIYAHVSKWRGEMKSLPPDRVSSEISALLNDPIVKNDAALRLRCLVVKGDADMDINSNLAQQDWSEAKSLAEKLQYPDWVSRASGELGVIAFLHGDSATAMMSVQGAIDHARKAHDIGALYRYSTLMANGLAEFGAEKAALKLYDEALKATAGEKDLGTPVLTITGKASALAHFGRTLEAERLLQQALADAQQTGNLGYESELYLELGKISLKTGDKKSAGEQFAKSAGFARRASSPRMEAEANYELAGLYQQSDIHKAEKAIIAGLDASRLSGDRYYLPKYLSEYAMLEALQGRTKHAEALFAEATDIRAAWRRRGARSTIVSGCINTSSNAIAWESTPPTVASA